MPDTASDSLEVEVEGAQVVLWLTIGGRRYKAPMRPTYASNLGIALLAGASKALNAENAALGLKEPVRFGAPKR